jgi:hypothetical protein
MGVSEIIMYYTAGSLSVMQIGINREKGGEYIIDQMKVAGQGQRKILFVPEVKKIKSILVNFKWHNLTANKWY